MQQVGTDGLRAVDTGDHDLPPLDPDAGLVRQAWDHGDHITVDVMTATEALEIAGKLAEKGSATAPAQWPDSPDDMQVADDGRPIAVHYSAAAKQQLGL